MWDSILRSAAWDVVHCKGTSLAGWIVLVLRRHVTTNLMIDVDEDAGTGSCNSYVTVFQHTDDFPLQPVYQNRYEDTFVREDGTWRFDHRLMCDHRPGDTSHHLRA